MVNINSDNDDNKNDYDDTNVFINSMNNFPIMYNA